MRKQLVLIPLVLVALLGVAQDAQSQTRFALEAGLVKPTGSFSDAVDNGAWFAIRAENQTTNALGQVAVLSYFLQAGMATFSLDSEFEKFLDANNLSSDTSYYEFTVGARVYSAAMPLFFSAGAGWGMFDPPGADSTSGFTPTVGAGLSFSLTNLVAEVEARAHLPMIDEKGVDDPTFLTFTAAIGLPF